MSGPLQDVIEEDAADLLFPKGKDYKILRNIVLYKASLQNCASDISLGNIFWCQRFGPSFQFQLTGWQ